LTQRQGAARFPGDEDRAGGGVAGGRRRAGMIATGATSRVSAGAPAGAVRPGQRLEVIKGRYDPDTFFHVNQNIRPAAREG
jgi:hypothetical protein